MLKKLQPIIDEMKGTNEKIQGKGKSLQRTALDLLKKSRTNVAYRNEDGVDPRMPSVQKRFLNKQKSLNDLFTAAENDIQSIERTIQQRKEELSNLKKSINTPVISKAKQTLLNLDGLPKPVFVKLNETEVETESETETDSVASTPSTPYTPSDYDYSVKSDDSRDSTCNTPSTPADQTPPGNGHRDSAINTRSRSRLRSQSLFQYATPLRAKSEESSDDSTPRPSPYNR